MSWSIFIINNTVKITDECAEALLESSTADDYGWEEIDYFIDGDYLCFDDDYDEHMDYVNAAADVLKEHKVEGLITFGSGEGDNDLDFWGYRFDGKGGMKNVKGTLSWEEDE